MEDKQTKNPSSPQPLFTNNPTNRTQPETPPDQNDEQFSLQNLPDNIKELAPEIPKATKKSRIARALAKLPQKDRIVVKELSKGTDERTALETAGYSESTINKSMKKVIGKDSIQSALHVIMENSGITDEFMMEKLKKGMDATKIHGTRDDFIEIEDFSVQHKFIETGLKLKGHLDKKVDIVYHKSHEDQLRELQDDSIVDADYEEILPD